MNVALLLSEDPQLARALEAALASEPDHGPSTLLSFQTPEEISEALQNLGAVELLFVDTRGEDSIHPAENWPPAVAIRAEQDGRLQGTTCIWQPLNGPVVHNLIEMRFSGGLNHEESLRLARDRALTRFHAGIAHDMNNRLTTLSGYISILEMMVDGEEEMIEDMTAAADRAGNLVRCMQAFQDQESSQPMPTDLGTWLKSLQEISHRMHHSRGKLTWSIPETSLTVVADQSSLTYLFLDALSWFANGPCEINVSLSQEGNEAVLSIASPACPPGYRDHPDWVRDLPLRKRLLGDHQGRLDEAPHPLTMRFALHTDVS